jgi:hypothetical protein
MKFAIALTIASIPALGADWNPKLAAQYLDAREKAWTEWPMAMNSGVACISCHTGMPYLIARPALRKALGQNQPTLYEGVLLAGLRATVVKTDAKDLFAGLKGPIVDQVYGAQAILSALMLAIDDAPRGRISPEGELALSRMWSLQTRNGKDKGGWQWSDFDLDPWETKDAAFYGGALGALATGSAPAGYQSRPEIRENIAEMRTWLLSGESAQPLHNRLFLLWSGAKLRDLLPDAQRHAILDEVWKKQEADGGWTLASLGPWKRRDSAPVQTGSNSYATGLVAFTLQRAGVSRSEPGMAKALAWLKSHQDPQSGAWTADSLNHKHDAGSMPAGFMSDAATGYAASALLGEK